MEEVGTQPDPERRRKQITMAIIHLLTGDDPPSTDWFIRILGDKAFINHGTIHQEPIFEVSNQLPKCQAHIGCDSLVLGHGVERQAGRGPGVKGVEITPTFLGKQKWVQEIRPQLKKCFKN